MAQAAVLFAALISIAMLGTGAAWVLAESTRGDARAINQAGTLRMESWRLAALLAHEGRLRPADGPAFADLPGPIDPGRLVEAHKVRFERVLRSETLTTALADDPDAPSRQAYERLTEQWHREIVPILQGIIDGDPRGVEAYRRQVSAFVGRLDHLVGLMEQRSADRIAHLNTVQLSALAITVLLALVTVAHLRRRMVRPLRRLQAMAGSVRTGNLEARTPEGPDDEFGAVSRSLNDMASRLHALNASLEERVEEKTAALQRSNRALQILYEATRAVSPDRFERPALLDMLGQVQRITGLGPLTVQLETVRTAEASPRGTEDDPGSEKCRAWTTAAEERPAFCTAPASGRCPCRPDTSGDSLPDGAIRLAIREGDRDYGVLIAEPGSGSPTEAWVDQLLKTVSAQIGRSYGLMLQTRERQRLALMEERAIIARELHDSLAQSLSYLKIQSARLERAIPDPGEADGSQGQDTAKVVRELRSGLNTAYRQLRDLLTTFRLQVEQPGLEEALRVTVDEFSRKGELPVHLHLEPLPPGISPHHEIHILQIVREALANTVRHARAGVARVRVERWTDEVAVLVEDNGRGTDPDADTNSRHGLAIMEERAAGLGGSLEVRRMEAGGTRVLLRIPIPWEETE